MTTTLSTPKIIRQVSIEAMSATIDPRAGLAWAYEDGPLGELGELLPTWTVEPDIEVITDIVRRKLNIPEVFPCVVELLAQGAFNKVYTVQCGGNSNVIVRVTLPVQPHLKTLSERATIEYVRHHTDIPIPQVLEYNAIRDDELGFEWMIMDRVEGTKVTEQWKHMSWLKKELLVRKVITYLAQLFRKRFHRLGNLYATEDIQQMSTKDMPDAVFLGAEHSSHTVRFGLGEVVSIPFFYNDHGGIDVPRGPYKHSRDWLATCLRLYLHDADNINASNKTVDPNSVEAIKSRIQRMLNFLPQIFPADEREEYTLIHQDLSDNNMMVDENHDLSGFIDWECVYTVPLWLACQLPRFLRGQNCQHPPLYATEFENEYYESAYYEDLELYEKTQLREFFFEEMERICPEWMRVHEASSIKADFEFAVNVCTMRGYLQDIDEWLDSVENGDEVESLRERLGQC
ncbi:kinase-like protein [Cucurbitaria berberidis CBS 394.84]|uniref:Kinase-like protein n=1 Tax=Cucurbitaria berberidis CBS 394.84 TaxID=1168544 RepID=A0A9P4L3G0_9PLEO|nr:kinase-like protein [Cucurbitaria berberidis CBS 394.84]KAF1840891.1 kinase-like protein [Cucurbitaria berberidis CBS 394.84]